MLNSDFNPIEFGKEYRHNDPAWIQRINSYIQINLNKIILDRMRALNDLGFKFEETTPTTMPTSSRSEPVVGDEATQPGPRPRRVLAPQKETKVPAIIFSHTASKSKTDSTQAPIPSTKDPKKLSQQSSSTQTT